MSLKGYLKESYTELIHKVTWPTWSELQNSGTLVLIATLIIAVIVALMDLSFGKIMHFIYGLLY